MDNKRLFTQKELEKHINARLVRERKKNGDIMLFKNMVDELMKSGIINADSYAEAGKRLTELLSVMPAGNSEEEALKDNIVENSVDNTVNNAVENTTKTTTENVNTLKADAQSENEVSKPDNPEYPEEIEESENVQLAEDVPFVVAGQRAETGEMLAKSDDESTKEMYGQELTGSQESVEKKLSRLCAELSRLLDGTAEKSITDNQDDEIFDDGFYARRSACSTGFSANSACDAQSSGFELTPTQRDIARRAGISYREYAELLKDIPDSTKKRRQRI